MKIAFVMLPFRDTALPPFELAQLAGLARQYGHEVVVHDLNALFWNRLRGTPEGEYWSAQCRMLWTAAPIARQFWDRHAPALLDQVREILAGTPGLIWIWTGASSLHLSLFLARRLRDEAGQTPVLIANRHLLLAAKDESSFWRVASFMDAAPVDGLIQGPPQDAFLLILRDLQGHGVVKTRPGVHCRKNGAVMLGSPPAPLGDPSRLPFADFTPFPLDLYDDKASLPLALSLGCDCPHCADLQDDAIVSGSRLFMEAVYQQRVFPRRRWVLSRWPGPLALPALRRFCQLSLENPSVEWSWELRTKGGVEFPANLLKLMARAGCAKIVRDVDVLDWQGPETNGQGAGDAAVPVEERFVYEPARPVNGNVFLREAVVARFKRASQTFPDINIEDERVDVFYLPNLLLPQLGSSASSPSPVAPGAQARIPEPARAPTRRLESMFKGWSALDALINKECPAEALRTCLELYPSDPVVSLLIEWFRADMLRLWSIYTRLHAAERLLERLPAGTRTEIWTGSPTFTDGPPNHGECCNHRRKMRVTPGNKVQRASRCLVAAAARASQIELASARVDFVADEERFEVRWARSRLSVRELFKLCNVFFDAIADSPASWRSAREEILKDHVRVLVARALAPWHDLARIRSLQARLRSAERILAELPPGARKDIWTESRTFSSDVPPSHAECWNHRRLMGIYPHHMAQRATRYLLTAAARASQIVSLPARIVWSEEDDRFQLRLGAAGYTHEALARVSDAEWRELLKAPPPGAVTSGQLVLARRPEGAGP